MSSKICILLLTGLLAACGGGDPAVCPPLDEHLSAINGARVENGSGPLRIDYTLLDVAQQHAIYLSKQNPDLHKAKSINYDSSGTLHFDANGNRVQSRLQAANYPSFAEEIAASGIDTINEVADAYLKSPIGHREWLLWSSATVIGLGCSVSDKNRVYWVHVLGN